MVLSLDSPSSLEQHESRCSKAIPNKVSETNRMVLELKFYLMEFVGKSILELRERLAGSPSSKSILLP
jgi:DNA-directed RNA polymerase specialized sigma54-like protein